jgi:hypothetical protein
MYNVSIKELNWRGRGNNEGSTRENRNTMEANVAVLHDSRLSTSLASAAGPATSHFRPPPSLHRAFTQSRMA